MEKYKVSIIMPVYNSEDYLDKAITSALSQSYKNIELVLINDGSTDRSLDICKKYGDADSRVIIINKQNEGVSAARNSGLNIITGDFLIFIDSDDYLAENAIEILIKKFEVSAYDMCAFSWKEIKDGKEKKRVLREGKYDLETVYKGILRSNYKYGGGFPWNKIWKCSSISNQGKYIEFRSLDAYEDKQWILENLDYIENGKITTIPDILYYYRLRAESLSHTQSDILAREKSYKALKCIIYLNEYAMNKHNTFRDDILVNIKSAIVNTVWNDVKKKKIDKITQSYFYKYKISLKCLIGIEIKIKYLIEKILIYKQFHN